MKETFPVPAEIQNRVVNPISCLRFQLEYQLSESRLPIILIDWFSFSWKMPLTDIMCIITSMLEFTRNTSA